MTGERSVPQKLEDHEQWPEIKQALVDASPAEVAKQFEVPVMAVRAAQRRTGSAKIRLVTRPQNPTQHPAKPSRKTTSRKTTSRKPKVQPVVKKASSKQGKSQQHLLEPHRHLIGTMPDLALAKIAGVSMWSVRGYRIKLGIPARGRGKNLPVAKGKSASVKATTAGTSTAAPKPKPKPKPKLKRKRKSGRRDSPIDAYAHLLGTMTDKDLAKRAGVSSGSVYQYRRNRGIPSLRANRKSGGVVATVAAATPVAAPAAAAPVAAPAPAPSALAPVVHETMYAFKVVFVLGNEGVAMGRTIADAASRLAVSGHGAVQSITRLAEML